MTRLLAQISSGCIYNGYEKRFTEEDEPNFTFNNGSFYSGSKALCEKNDLKAQSKVLYLSPAYSF